MQRTQDLQYLRLLSIFYYVVGGIAGLFACLPFIYLVLGIAMVSGQLNQSGTEPPPAEIGWLFIALAAVGIALGLAFAVGLCVTGYLIARRRAYFFCLVMAGFACLFHPFGTVLGVFTFIVLLRPGVNELFERGETREDADPRSPEGSG